MRVYRRFFLLLFALLLTPAHAQFTDISSHLNLGSGRHVAWGDYDNDGWDDLMINGRKLFRNTADGNFVEVTSDARLDQLPTYISAGCWADLDNDGWLDFAGVNGQGSDTNLPDYILHNEGDGNFTWNQDITDYWGTAAMGWGDYDNDGLLDVYMAASEVSISGNYAYHEDNLFWNIGNGHFANVTDSAGMSNMPPLYGRSVCWSDYDLDGDQDCYIGNYRLHPNFMWHNQNDGTFNEIGHALGVAGHPDMYQGNGPYYGHTIGAAWGDFTNDALLDLAVINLAHPGWFLQFSDISRLYINEGPPNWGFTEWQENQSGISYYETHSSPAWADYDNDGFLDLFITCVYPNRPAFLYRNNGDLTFTDTTTHEQIDVRNGWGAAWADYDNDGDMDLLAAEDTIKLFRNDSATGNWLKVQLEGRDSNRSAIGAQVEIEAGQIHTVRQVEAGMGTCSSQNSLTLHFGLGSNDRVDTMTIRWPSGLVDMDYNVPVNMTRYYVEDGGVERGSLTGQITDSISGSPLEKVRVALDGIENGYVAFTDVNGSYTFTQIRAGFYDMRLDLDGYFPGFEADVNVSANQVTTQDMVLDYAEPLEGTYTIDPSGGNYDSISEAIDIIEIAGVKAPVIFEIADGNYALPPLRFGSIAGVSNLNTITFRPAPNASVKLLFTPRQWDSACLRFDNAQHIVLDGSNSGSSRDMTIQLLNLAQTDQTMHLIHIGQGRDSGNITIKNCILEGLTPNFHLGYGILVEGKSCVLRNNLIKNVYKGIALLSAENTHVVENDIGEPGIFGVVTGHGIYANAKHSRISGNIIQNLYSIQQEPHLTGIYLWNDINSTLVNNMLFDFYDSSNSSVVRGMRVLNSQEVKLYHNTVYLRGSESRRPSLALYFEENSVGEAINNIFCNQKDGPSNDIGVHVRNADLNLNSHNFIAGTDVDAKDFTPDANSIIGLDPGFNSDSDLHLAPRSACRDAGVYLANVPEDFEGETRHDPPSIGADEFNAAYPTPTPLPTNSPTAAPTNTPEPTETLEPTETPEPTLATTPTTHPTNTPVADCAPIALAGYWDTQLDANSGGKLALMALCDPFGARDIQMVEVFYQGTATGIELTDDGTGGDLAANDGLWGFSMSVPLPLAKLRITLNLVTTDSQGIACQGWPYLEVR